MKHKITIELPRAKYTSRQYELYSSVPGHISAAKHINGWMDTEIAARATNLSVCRGDQYKVFQIALEIMSAVDKRIYEAEYHKKYGATDSEPAYLIKKHISEVCCFIGGLSHEEA